MTVPPTASLSLPSSAYRAPPALALASSPPRLLSPAPAPLPRTPYPPTMPAHTLLSSPLLSCPSPVSGLRSPICRRAPPPLRCPGPSLPPLRLSSASRYPDPGLSIGRDRWSVSLGNAIECRSHLLSFTENQPPDPRRAGGGTWPRGAHREGIWIWEGSRLEAQRPPGVPGVPGVPGTPRPPWAPWVPWAPRAPGAPRRLGVSGEVARWDAGILC
jgi:hypothetical protein